MGMMARSSEADINVIALIGERGREVAEFIHNDLGPEGLKRSIVIVATSDEPALVRMRAAFIAQTMAEYFRDKGLNVMLMMDSLTRFAMASREIGLALGEPPTSKGYTPSIYSQLPKLLERAGIIQNGGSITGFYTILSEGDDILDPIADAVRAIVDGHIVLSRDLTKIGHYPPIDVLQSLSRVMKQVVSNDHYHEAQRLRRAVALYKDAEDFIRLGVYQKGQDVELDKVVERWPRIIQFLTQGASDSVSSTVTMKELSGLGV
jgi:flagellum-specific ATP synthase